MSVNALSPRSGGVIGTIGPIGGKGVWSLKERGLLAQDFYDDVSLLLHMNGANGSTSFLDSSRHNHTVTANGNAQISTAESKFGGASGAFDGTGDFLTVTGDHLLTADFTVEAWAYPTTASGTRWLIAIGNESSGRLVFGLINGNLSIDRFGIATNSFTGGTVAADQWSHVAISRQGSNLRAFVEGVLLQTVTISGTLGNANQLLRVGSNPSGNQGWLGNIDDLRITKGVARYTGSFTPPQRQFRP